MPANGFNVGRDVSIDIIGPSGPLRVPIRTGFTSKQETNSIKIKAADGNIYLAELPDGWSGTLDYERASSTLDDYFALLEQNYYSGLNLQSLSITETITEVNGAITQYRYTQVVLKYDDAGAKAGDQTIKQKVAWMASRRLKIA